MRVVLMGTSAFAIPALTALAASSHDLAAVVTRQDKPAGRGLHCRQAPVRCAAEALGLPLLQPARIGQPESVGALAALRYDLGVVVAYGQLLPVSVLRIPPLGTVNIHASLLPRYRGAAPIQRAIMAGDKETGVSAMWVSEGLDEGDIIAQRTVAIHPDETYGLLHDRLAEEGARLLLDTLDGIAAGRAARFRQDPARATLAPPLRPEERQIDWNRSAEEIRNQVRALAPTPGAFCLWRGKRLKVWRAEKVLGAEGVPGRIVENTKAGPVVTARRAALALVEVQLEGRRRMSGGEFVCGYRPLVGEDLQE